MWHELSLTWELKYKLCVCILFLLRYSEKQGFLVFVFNCNTAQMKADTP